MSNVPSTTAPAASSSGQYTYSAATAPYFPTPFHLQQTPQPPPVPYIGAAPPPSVPLPVYPAPPTVYTLPQYQQAQQLFQRDAQTITPEALESVKAALASSDIEHKAETKKKVLLCLRLKNKKKKKSLYVYIDLETFKFISTKKKKMESFSYESFSLSHLDYFNLLLLRPIAAILFTLSLLFFGWFLAWKLVLVHVPLVQEIFGLREKIVKPKPTRRRRIIQFYNKINAQNPSSE